MDLIEEIDNIMSIEDLKEQAEQDKKDSPFIKIDSGESFTGKFLDVEKSPKFEGAWDYKFEVDGVEKVFTCGSKRLRTAMLKVVTEPGQTLTVKREGEGFKTSYTVTVSGEVTVEEE